MSCPPPYKRYLPLAVVAISFLVLYHHVITKLIHDWSIDGNYSHGFLVPFISGYLIWQKRERLAEIELKPADAGLVFLLLSCCFMVATYLCAELFTMRFSMILVIWSIVVFLAGWEWVKALFLPVAYLMFMIPLPAIIWNKIAFPLKLFATHIAVQVIQLLGITVYGEGNIIHLSNTTLEVVDACSGLRSLTSLLALSAAFALISTHTVPRKMILFLSAVPIAIATNIFRLSFTAVLASRYGGRVAQGFLHEASGMVVFFLALIILFFLNMLLKKSPKS